jgi:His-Xaa-Ser system radical SAM maturase HxsC
MRRVKASFSDGVVDGVYRVVSIESLAGQWVPDLRLLVLIRSASARQCVELLARAETGHVRWTASELLLVGDVVSARPGRGEATVIFRESDAHHSLLVTNRCNSYCLMCSQPPTSKEDGWLVNEALEAIRHIRASPRTLGISGGEPLLLGDGLRQLLASLALYHPETSVDVLTNGRLFADEVLAKKVLGGLECKASWLVPLYGHADFMHDFVVQARGAFDETIGGLLALQLYRQPIQLRIVLIEPVLRVLPELCRFIGRSLPFVREVALMGCEPIGLALANRDACEVDLVDWSAALEQGARELRRHGMPYLFMNTPLCSLPKDLWDAAHRSISEWKQVYVEECANCAVKERCSGLFAWHERGWKPTKIRAFEEAPK